MNILILFTHLAWFCGHCGWSSSVSVQLIVCCMKCLCVSWLSLMSNACHSLCFSAYYYYTCLTAFFPGLPGWGGTRKVKPIWIWLKQETMSGSGISWAICKSSPRSRQITTPAPHHSVFYRPDALPAAQPTVSKHWICSGISWFIIPVVLWIALRAVAAVGAVVILKVHLSSVIWTQSR